MPYQARLYYREVDQRMVDHVVVVMMESWHHDVVAVVVAVDELPSHNYPRAPPHNSREIPEFQYSTSVMS